jgi:hypothetical protein
MPVIKQLFLNHPAKVGEGYFAHMGVAFGISARLFRAASAALIHGIVPACCETTASSEILAMSDGIRARRAIADREASARS